MNNMSIKERLLKLSTPLVGDAMWQYGLQGAVDPAIRALVPFSKIVGTAVTLKFQMNNTNQIMSSPHYDRAFNACRSVFDAVMCIEMPKEAVRAGGIFGEGAATAAIANGCIGAVVDGDIRDTHELARMNFPVFHRGICLSFISAQVISVGCNEPINIGGITIRPKDIVFADNDGVLIIPRDKVELIIKQAGAIKRWEHKMHSNVARGLSFEESEKICGSMPNKING